MLFESGEEGSEDAFIRGQVLVVDEGPLVLLRDVGRVVGGRLHHVDGEVHENEPAYGLTDAAKSAVS